MKVKVRKMLVRKMNRTGRTEKTKLDMELPFIPFFTSDIPSARRRKRNQNI